MKSCGHSLNIFVCMNFTSVPSYSTALVLLPLTLQIFSSFFHVLRNADFKVLPTRVLFWTHCIWCAFQRITAWIRGKMNVLLMQKFHDCDVYYVRASTDISVPIMYLFCMFRNLFCTVLNKYILYVALLVCEGCLSRCVLSIYPTGKNYRERN